MKIHEVSRITGLTKKSIRYYEDMGLLNPKRCSNDYREYNQEDIKDLELIKFLRELEVPVLEIKKLKRKDLRMKECMEERLRKIEEKEKSYEKIKNVCEMLASDDKHYEELDVREYQMIVNSFGDKNYMSEDIKKSHKEKIRGALITSLIFISFFGFIIGIMTYFQITQSDDNIPMVIFIFLIMILLLPILGIIINLVSRIKEIRGGEEDEACKY